VNFMESIDKVDAKTRKDVKSVSLVVNSLRNYNCAPLCPRFADFHRLGLLLQNARQGRACRRLRTFSRLKVLSFVCS
jgi:hypothetical protein